jgi:hypothetical protein
MQRRQLDEDVGDGGAVGRKAPAQGVQIGQLAGLQFGVDRDRQLGLAGAFVRQRARSGRS